MARRPTSRRETQITFQFDGWRDGWYVLRAYTGRPHTALTAHAMINQIVEWLIEQGITPNTLSYLTNGNTGDGPIVPLPEDGNTFALLFRRPTDVMRFHLRFGCRNLTPGALFAAIRREASVHKFVMADIAQIAYRAMQEYDEIHGDRTIAWERLTENGRQFLLQMTREYLEHPDWPAARQHEAWVDTRLKEDWQFGATIDYRARRHPWLVPFHRLPEKNQAKSRLFAGVVASLAGH